MIFSPGEKGDEQIISGDPEIIDDNNDGSELGFDFEPIPEGDEPEEFVIAPYEPGSGDESLFDVIEPLKESCNGYVKASSAEGYEGEELVVTLHIDPPVSEQITKVSVVSGCPKCVATYVEPGVYKTVAEWYGAGPVYFSFTAYDADGDARCTISAPALQALGPKVENEGSDSVYGGGGFFCNATMSFSPEEAEVGDTVQITFALGDVLAEKAESISITAPGCTDCSTNENIFSTLYYFDYEVPFVVDTDSLAVSYTVYDKDGLVVCIGPTGYIKFLGFRKYDFSE